MHAPYVLQKICAMSWIDIVCPIATARVVCCNVYDLDLTFPMLDTHRKYTERYLI